MRPTIAPTVLDELLPPTVRAPLTRWDQMIGLTQRDVCALLVTPLARAALDNGVAFDDVHAYVQADSTRDVDRFQASLDRELATSVGAREPARSRVWWQPITVQVRTKKL